MNLQKLFKYYKPDNRLEDKKAVENSIRQKRKKLIIILNSIVAACAFSGLFIGAWCFALMIPAAMFSMMFFSDSDNVFDKQLAENNEKLCNEQILEIVENLLVKNLKKVVSNAFESERVKKCEVYLVAIHAAQQFLIGYAKNEEGKKNFFESENIRLIKLLNEQKFAIQSFIDEYKNTGNFDYAKLEPLSGVVRKEEHFSLLPSSILIDNYHGYDLDALGVLDENLNAYGLNKGIALPFLKIDKLVENKEQVRVSKSSFVAKEENIFNKVNKLINTIGQDYEATLMDKSKVDFGHIKNERYPEIINLYERVEGLADKEFFIEGIQKAVNNLEEDLSEIIQLSRDNLLKEIKVVTHTAKMKHVRG